jgi:hypothetical protein
MLHKGNSSVPNATGACFRSPLLEITRKDFQPCIRACRVAVQVSLKLQCVAIFGWAMGYVCGSSLHEHTSRFTAPMRRLPKASVIFGETFWLWLSIQWSLWENSLNEALGSSPAVDTVTWLRSPCLGGEAPSWGEPHKIASKTSPFGRPVHR